MRDAPTSATYFVGLSWEYVVFERVAEFSLQKKCYGKQDRADQEVTMLKTFDSDGGLRLVVRKRGRHRRGDRK